MHCFAPLRHKPAFCSRQVGESRKVCDPSQQANQPSGSFELITTRMQQQPTDSRTVPSLAPLRQASPAPLLVAISLHRAKRRRKHGNHASEQQKA